MKSPSCILLTLSAILLSTSALSAAVCESVSYGAGIGPGDPTPVAAILDAPESYLGKEVQVEGRVHDVCEMAGCWMEIEAADAERVIKIKVKDGEIELPVSARGKTATARGKVERLEMSRSKYVKYRKHLAAEQGASFDEGSVRGDGPFFVYQIAGTGAAICR